ncbi:unnamed protein product [Cuscuta europaea]|uniref:Uncharacterized protein n=1 Tax=Cuscuta europaea TaxID=41803 RepID=A0A9P0Z827_CUSEU|nr:unnamed protein product [Cuscuta europaea]
MLKQRRFLIKMRTHSIYNAARDFMMHGPCGSYAKSAPCMANKRCSKHFPKGWCSVTTIDGEGYPVYRRRDDGRTIEKSKVPLDNRFVVRHNRFLLMKYDGHINVKWCNQSRSIKYLFKYINKGHDRVTVGFFNSASGHEETRPVDEIKMYYDCCYISPCEAAWRILGCEIQYKNPPVERLIFHLKGEQTVIFSDNDPLNSVVGGRSVKDIMFLGWMEANKKYEMARQLTYAEFPQKFVWKSGYREWMPRKKLFPLVGYTMFHQDVGSHIT